MKAKFTRTKQPSYDYRQGETPMGKKASVGNPLGDNAHPSAGAPLVPIMRSYKHPAAK